MLQWLDSVAGPGYVAAILWTFAALILLVVVLLVIKVVRNLTFGTFVAGGRNRKTRLAVMDATAVDSHRRLVLVRRDDIEHLILIGGPTDVVVERDIRLAAPRRPALTGDSGQQQAAAPRPRAPQPAPAPARQSPVPAPAPVTESTARPRTVTSAPGPVAPSQPTAKVMPLPAYGTPNGSGRHAPPPPSNDTIDDTLMNELEASLDEQHPKPASSKPAAKPSLDDEMTKLLGELANHKR
ncbi:flagellar biosynthetic protein FliO [Mesorhizobium sp. VK23B]|uniref:Flagellar biosynthetic protein FliO n=1 Tax=Mesorhizobium dulcispinae TaxID=3072316 RepID=A0ABU4X816_9HYPH|nr:MULTISPECIES: flagellar biosynthetic protein FliO [unclassified Mesorhizobium]MDX8464551.1 flagellar biosynthetic protein FliO [Mesorhizobium sp. VK23B]MDX8470937.1 flagellar biosynthetic protein FliO [Mesorhizobium sp. VK23A]MDX8517556.1 flagellar biosynthetic protein FliO [Mesorhizobium sp. VK23D]